MDWLMVLVELH